MKTYLIKSTFKNAKYYRSVIIEIYRIKHNVPVFIGGQEFNTGGWKGEKSCALDILLDHKEISKKAYGDGYFKSDNSFKLYSI